MSVLLVLFAMQALAQTPPTEDPNHPSLDINTNIDARFLRKFDRNRDGAVNLSEFQDAMTERLKEAAAANPAAMAKITPEFIREFRNTMIADSFRKIDRNGDGRITEDELYGAGEAPTTPR